MANVLFKQIILMFLLMVIGYLLYRTKKISIQGNKELGTILIYVILPASILKSYLTEFTKEKMIALLISLIAAVLSLALAIAVSRLAFGKKKKIEHFGAAFSNAGFIGIPLVKKAVGGDAVFYIAAFVALLNILQWTYGVYIMSESREAISIKKILTNPVVLALLFGLGIFTLQIQIPGIFVDVFELVGNMTAPVAMITLGVYLAQTPLKEMLTEKSTYICSLCRLLVIPLLTIGILSLLPNEYRDIKLTILIAAAAPVGSNVAIFAERNNLDYSKAVKNVCISTILSIVTLPIIIGIAGVLWK